ncbi:MAG: 16S rRNA (cytidine(1402)-2'-O)-methyltransferase [Thermodesulfobacteriota bacterium]
MSGEVSRESREGRGTLYIVATPIGNMEDITIRAIRILKEVALIAAEDTRHTRNLLKRYDIETPLTSYHEHNEERKAESLLARLREGTNIAIVTDAGTPGISDPGYRLVKMAAADGIDVVAIPGPSALIAALSLSGLPTDGFIFEGFPPSRKTERRKFLLRLNGVKKTIILYESPRRIAKTVADIGEIMGDVELVIARELTKLHEEVMRGRAGEILEILEGCDIKGEITLLIAPRKGEERGEIPIDEGLRHYLDLGFTVRDAVDAVAAESGLPRRSVYRVALEMKEGRKKRNG